MFQKILFHSSAATVPLAEILGQAYDNLMIPNPVSSGQRGILGRNLVFAENTRNGARPAVIHPADYCPIQAGNGNTLVTRRPNGARCGWSAPLCAVIHHFNHIINSALDIFRKKKKKKNLSCSHSIDANGYFSYMLCGVQSTFHCICHPSCSCCSD